MNEWIFGKGRQSLWGRTITGSAFVAAVVVTITVFAAGPPAPNVSINSTSQNSADVGAFPYSLGPVPQQPFTGTGGYQLVGINDLGMHCGDLDTRIASILPPFQVLLTQVIQKGSEPKILGPGQVDVFYSAAANPIDPILTQTSPNPFTGLQSNGHVYKTNFWNVIASYDPFYPPNVLCTPNPAGSGNCVVPPDKGLPVPNVENLYIGPDGRVNSGDEFLSAVQHAMPGIARPYTANNPQRPLT